MTGSCDAEGDKLRTTLSKKEKEFEMRQTEMMEIKTEMDQLLEKLEEARKQLNQAKVKEAEMANQLQDQAQKVRVLMLLATPTECVATEKVWQIA